MNNQFKPGDLALIVGSSTPANLGKVVELVRATNDKRIELSPGRVVLNPGGHRCWEIIADDLIATSKRFPDGRLVKCGAIAEHRLMPLRGDFQPERQQSREVKA